MIDYSTEFDALRKNRVEVSYHKYGPARDNFGGGQSRRNQDRRTVP